MGLLYGYFAEDPVYEKGVRAVIEVLYEPPQENSFNRSELLPDAFENHVEAITSGLGFEKLGIVFTTFNKDVFLSSEEMINSAKVQEKYKVLHPIGLEVSKQITVVLRGNFISRFR